MKAAFIEQLGEPEVIRYGDLPKPTPAASEILVKIGAVSVNPIDTYIRKGMVAMPLPQPYILGCDFAGTVEAVGSAVASFRVGDRVWGSNQGLLGRQGTFAEFACIEERWAYPAPVGVSDTQLAAGALVGITAALGLRFCTHLQAGETVFVNGGTGGVGMMVVQLAKALGASKVITTVGSAEKARLAKELGADVVLNYKTDDITAGVKEATEGKGVNLFYETQPPTDLQKTIEMTAPFGHVIVMAGRSATPIFPNGPFYVKGLNLHGFAMFNVPAQVQRSCAELLSELLAAKKLKALIGAAMPLAQAAEAHRLQEANTLGKAGTLTGKIVLVP